MDLIELSSNIKWLRASAKPLSSDVIFIKTDKANWIFDVGLTSQGADEINKIEGPKNIVLSHFHHDHILNIPRVNYTNLYLTKNTKRYVHKGTVVSGALEFDENPKIKIVELPSSHAKGCLSLICEDYAFLGDGAFCKPPRLHHYYNVQLLKEMIEVMESMNVKYFCLDHEQNFIQEKNAVIKLYKDIYARRTPDSPIINVDDYF